MTYSIGFLIYDGFDLEDMAGPYAVLAQDARFTLHTVARTKDIVTAHGGLQILPDHIYPDAEIYDAILIPGGPGHQQALQVLRLMNWINQASRLAQVIAAVNTGIYLLAAARLLNGQTVAAVHGLTENYPDVQTVESRAVVQSGKLHTISTNSAAPALALTIIEAFKGA